MIGKWHQYYHPPNDGMGVFWDHAVMWKKTGYYYILQQLAFDGADPISYYGYSTDYFTDFAEQYIRREHDRPWFLWLCYDAVHGPYLPAGRHQDRYRNGQPVPVPADILPPRLGKPRYVRDMDWYWQPGRGHQEGQIIRAATEGLVRSERWRDIQPPTLQGMIRMYHRAVLAVDEGVGRLLDTLEETGQTQNTLVIFTSDQGFAFGEHGFEDKVAPYDANIQVPLMVRWPAQFASNRTCDHPAGQLDVVAHDMCVGASSSQVCCARS